MKRTTRFIWASPFTESMDKSRDGDIVTTDYRYSVSFALELAEAICAERLLADGKPFDMSLAAAVRFYDGSQVDPDPLLVAANGENVPAFRGVPYVVIESLDVSMSRRIPDFEIAHP